MPSIKAKEFQTAFATVLKKGGRIAAGDVAILEKAANAIGDAREKTAAKDVVALFKHDRILDESEVDPAREALCRLLGVPAKKLPPALEAVLKNAVPVPNVRVLSYDLEFDFQKDAPTFPARAQIKLESPSKKTCILEIDPERLHIDDVKVAGKSVPFAIERGRLVVHADNASALDIAYHVKPTNDVKGYGLIRDQHTGRLWTLTWPYNTGALFPSTSRPDDGATARVTVHVKGGQQAISAGRAHADGSFHLDRPVPAYAIAFTTGKLTDMQTAVVDGYEARTVGLGSEISAEIRKEMRENTAATMAFLSRRLGKNGFGSTMNIVEIKSTYGGMEHGGAIAIAVGQSRADLIEACVHETTHHWFGDGVHIKHWGELWMSEGFTNYMTWRFFGERDGDEAMFRYFDDAKDQLRAQLEHGISQPLDEPVDTDPEEGLSWVPYMQGAWMLRMLECQVGTDKLDGLLRDWYQAEKGEAISTADFIAFARTKGIETGPMFKAWADLKHIPAFKDKSKLDGNTATLMLEAKHDDQPPMKVPVLLEGAHGEKKMALVTPGEKLVVDAGFAVKSLTWDPQRTLLCDVL